ncbi:MAG: PepSY domain-containing protein, partial [Cellvibrionaceae bacterium]|nr:PepSY domain-containing protein [Cellvibrionaceae bacterium]
MKQTTLDLPRRMLASHRWLGLAAAVLLYLICFSGVLSVLAQELERWEQPGVDEFTQVDAEFVDRAYRRFLAEVDAPTEHIHIVYPRRAIPRLVVENDEQAFFINHDGSLGPEEHAPWTKMVTAIHHHLQLPQLIGSIILGIVAVMMLGLLISGLLAHTTILREAFSLRFNRGKKMRHIDTHNRLSVWGLPFHLMIIFTSAYFGLAGILLALAAELFHDGDRQAIIDTVFGQEPTLIEQAKVVDVAAAIKNMQQLAPGAKTVFSTIHEAGSESQFIEFYNVKDGRLIY